MMNLMKDREQAFESAYQQKQEQERKKTYRRNRLFAKWVSDELNLKGEQAEELEKIIFLSDLEEPGDDDILRTTIAQMKAHGVEVDKATLERRLEHFMTRAGKQDDSPP
ncbi:MAG: ATPase inhibitor subunit zeta [Pseudomonadota bacterium]